MFYRENNTAATTANEPEEEHSLNLLFGLGSAAIGAGGGIILANLLRSSPLIGGLFGGIIGLGGSCFTLFAQRVYHNYCEDDSVQNNTQRRNIYGSV